MITWDNFYLFARLPSSYGEPERYLPCSLKGGADGLLG